MLDAVPAFVSALASGAVTADHADMLPRRSRPNPPSPPRVSRPILGERHHHLAALALVDLVSTRTDTDTGPGGSPRYVPRVEMRVHIDYGTLLNGLHDRSVVDIGSAATLPVETIRRLACDADIIPIVVSGAGVVLDVGPPATRHHRSTPGPTRRYRTCSISDCTVAFEQCIVHHIQPFATGGRTDLHAMVPLCSRHHHAVREAQFEPSATHTTPHHNTTTRDNRDRQPPTEQPGFAPSQLSV